MFMLSTQEILMIFVALETASLSLYAMAGFARHDRLSAEAALKYFLIGAMSSAFMLFGLSLVYGLTGETSLSGIASKLHGEMSPLLMLALAMVLIGLGFKIASAPFHIWAPDVYQGAPLPTASLIASGSKIAGFFLLMQVVQIGFSGHSGDGAWRHFATGWVPILVAMAVLSMIVGNLAAIAQRSVRRLLAYSAIAHAGYILIGIAANNADGRLAALYYMATYALTAVGAFGVVAIVMEKCGGDSLESFAGLSQRAPLVSWCMLVFMLSLAGIPPLAGFFGKFYLFVAAIKADPNNLGLLWLVILAIAMSAVSLYYYLLVLKQIFVADPKENGGPMPILPATQWMLVFLALAVVLMGCMPDLLLSKFSAGR
jgi:NADH-quinone oxidoreductase subunit N